MKKRAIWLVGFVALLFFLSMLGSLVWLNGESSDARSWFKSDQIGVLEIRGIIADDKDTREQLKELREDRSIKAIVVRINSPGGGVGPSQEIYQELRRIAKQKPVVASMGSIAASGGYYIASATTHIVANPGTLTGSIGVIVNFSNLHELFDKIGYQMVTIKSGRFKDIGNPDREMTPEEKQLIQDMIDGVHRQFIRDVAKGRGLPDQEVEKIADGRIFTGETAKDLGLVDQLGNFDDAVQAAARLAAIRGEPELVYIEKKKNSLLEFLLGSETTARFHALLDDPWQPIRYQTPYPLAP